MMRTIALGLIAFVGTACSSLPSLAIESPVVGVEPTPHVRLTADGELPNPDLRVTDLAWMAGHWTGEGMGGHCEEQWGAPLNDIMLGTFRMANDDGIMFYEFLTMVEDSEGVVLELVHLSEELDKWEEPGETTTFRLFDVQGQTAFFRGLTIHRDGDTLLIHVSMSHGDEVSEVGFRMQRSRS